jgi:hypothetical protein
MIVLLVVLVLVLGAVRLLSAPGPNRVLVATSRYGLAPWVAVVVVGGAAAAWWFFPAWRSTIASVGVLAGLAWVWAARRYRWLRRAGVRGRWPSVVRSCGLARLDRRGESWPFDVTTTVTGAVRVEWLPVLTRPRHVEGVGVRFRLVPARGGSIGDVAQVAEQLAAGLRVARVEVARTAPSLGTLTAVYR